MVGDRSASSGSPGLAGPGGQVGICLLGTAWLGLMDSSGMVEMEPMAEEGRCGGRGRVRAMVVMVWGKETETVADEVE